MKIGIVIPTYNEKDNIKKLIPKIFEVFKNEDLKGEVIVVDDSSPDGTSKIVKKLKEDYSINLIQRKEKKGLGSAYIAGFKKALENKLDLIFEMDADLSHDPKEIPNFLEKVNKGADLVIGSRRVNGGKTVGWNWYRKLVSLGGNFIGKFIAGIDFSDLTSGYRVYKNSVLQNIDLKKIESEGYAFQLEMLARVIKKDYNVDYVPIVFKDRVSGESKLSKIELLKFLWTAFKIRFELI